MNLKPRFLLLTILLFLVTAIPLWFAVRTLAESIVEQWAVRYAEKQVLYDKSRTLQPILREVALSRQLANSQYIRAWARKPDDAGLTRSAIGEMESFRKNFADQSYFVALRENGHYYHNNAANEFGGREFRYVLKPEARKDAWFFDLIRQGRDIHINVNPDLELGITKLWIDVLIRDGNDILGIAGTGLDLTSFIENVVEVGGPGVTSLFVDHDGAIQLHRNQKLIDFATISKQPLEHKRVDLLFGRDEDRVAILAAMKELEAQKKTVATIFVEVGGKRHLAGLAYLPEIAWYEITLLDLNTLLPFSDFFGILAAYALTLLGALALFNLALGHFVLEPLKRLDRAMTEVESGNSDWGALDKLGSGEIGRLIRRFVRMAQAVLESRRDLEAKVAERTTALERLTKIDPLTELFNRRGMTERLEAELTRAEREQRRVGILWLDIDEFKEINDRSGHAVGDAVLKAVAETIRQTLRPYDVAARWGGDEFLILLQPTDAGILDNLGERLRLAISADRRVIDGAGHALAITVSIGGHLSRIGEHLDSVLLHGDQALYAAKAAGRNCYRGSTESVAASEGCQA